MPTTTNPDLLEPRFEPPCKLLFFVGCSFDEAENPVVECVVPLDVEPAVVLLSEYEDSVYIWCT